MNSKYCLRILLLHCIQFVTSQTLGNRKSKLTVQGTHLHEFVTQQQENGHLRNFIFELSESISKLNKRVEDMGRNIERRFQIIGESINEGKSSLNKISSRLNILDNLSFKVEVLESKIEDEKKYVKNVMSIANRDVQRLATQLEELERQPYSGNQPRDARSHPRKDAYNFTSEEPPLMKDQKGISQYAAQIGNTVALRIERMMPRLLAAELNHFYLNMATKTDNSLGQFQRDLVMRLRRIEVTSEKSLVEASDGRQDISHLSHLHKTLIKDVSNLSNYLQLPQNIERPELFYPSMKVLIKQSIENATEEISLEIKKQLEEDYYIYPKAENLKSPRGKVGISRQVSGYKNGTKITHPKLKESEFNCGMSGECLDSTTSATLLEVKNLFNSLLSKGEDLRNTLSKQTGEGVGLLKLLHQRFSLLLRRINNEPKHEEALLAEIQELEHLVENSYSSILLAQNVFIESCQRMQEEQPTIERQIYQILSKLITNIDLGHQFNRKQLREVRELLERIKTDGLSKNLTVLPAMILKNESNLMATTEMNCDHLLGLQEEISDHLIVFSNEINSSSEKLQSAFTRLNAIEIDIQNLDWNVENPKNIVDELLTNLKDVKGYSRRQIKLVQSFHEKLFQILDNFDNDNYTNSINKALFSQQQRLQNYEQNYSQPENTLHIFEKYENIYEYCLNLASQNFDLHPVENYTEFHNISRKEDPLIIFNRFPLRNTSINRYQETVLTIDKPAVLFPTRSTYNEVKNNPNEGNHRINVKSFHEEDMFMDDAFTPNKISNATDNSLSEQNITLTVPPIVNPSSIGMGDKFYENRTVIEDDIYVNG